MAKGGKKGKPKLSKAERERLKKEEAERRQQEEEEARLKAEQEAKEREERERQEREERRLLEEQERARHQVEVDELNIKIEQNKADLAQLKKERWAQETWDRYMQCDGNPDPLSIKELNTYMNLWREDVSEKKIEEVLQECEVALKIINQIQGNIDANFVTEPNKSVMQETIYELQNLIFLKLDQATFQLLRSPFPYIDQETFNITHTAKSKNITVCIWGNTAKNPRVKLVEFPEQGFSLDLPKNLAMADVAIRVIYMGSDFLSPKSPSYHIQEPKRKQTADSTGRKSESKDENAATPDVEKPPSTPQSADRTSTSGRKISTKTADNSVKDEESKRADSKVTLANTEAEERETTFAEMETLVDIFKAGDEAEGYLLDEDTVDLRSFAPLGDLIYIELLQLPPQPKQYKEWILQQTVDSTLKRVPYTISFTPMTRSASAGSNQQGADLALDESRGSGPPTSNLNTPVGHTAPPIVMRIGLPQSAVVFEDPQLVTWDETTLSWRLNGVMDLKYDQEQRAISFKSTYFGPYAIMQDLYLNMPFQSWELRPMGLNHCILSISAASIDVELEIKEDKCRLAKPEDKEELSHVIDQWMTAETMMKKMRSAGLNMFSAEDGKKYVSICEKDPELVESLYQQMALSASAFAYSWSHWSNDNKKSNAVVVQASEWLEAEPVHEDSYSLYMASPIICFRLKMKEYDSDFDETLAKGAQPKRFPTLGLEAHLFQRVDLLLSSWTEMHPSLFHVLQDGCNEKAKALVQNTSFVFSDCVLSLLQAANVLIYS